MFGFIELLLISFSIFCIATNKVMNYSSEPIFNVYQRPNGFYWFKVIFMFIILYTKQLVQKIKLALQSEEDLKEYYKKLETPQKLSNHDQPIDAVYFNAANNNGEHLVVGTARRKHGLIDSFLFIKINDERIGVLESPKLPDTSLYQNVEKEEYNAEGLKVECLDPMKKWKITYQGKMKKSTDATQTLDVNLEVIYTSNLPFFNFDTDMDAYLSAKCIALERWSSEYFKLLKMHHQTHYEQHGNLKGQAIINNDIFPIDMESMRDHSFGNHREWRDLHKYNFQMFATENGDRFTVGDICFPLTLSSFQMGFVYSANDKKIYPITSNDFQLYQHGESGIPPLDYAFTIKAGGRTYAIKVNVVDSPYLFISKDWECKVTERFCTFEVNGMRGWGASEWQQRNMLGRNIFNNQDVNLISKKDIEIDLSIDPKTTTKVLPVRRLVGLESTQIFEKMLKR